MNRQAADGFSGLLEWADPVIFDRLLEAYGAHDSAISRSSGGWRRLHSRVWRALIEGDLRPSRPARDDLVGALRAVRISTSTASPRPTRDVARTAGVVVDRFRRTPRVSMAIILRCSSSPAASPRRSAAGDGGVSARLYSRRAAVASDLALHDAGRTPALKAFHDLLASQHPVERPRPSVVRPGTERREIAEHRARDAGDVESQRLFDPHPDEFDEFRARGERRLPRDARSSRVGDEEARVESPRAAGRRDRAGEKIEAVQRREHAGRGEARPGPARAASRGEPRSVTPSARPVSSKVSRMAASASAARVIRASCAACAPAASPRRLRPAGRRCSCADPRARPRRRERRTCPA